MSVENLQKHIEEGTLIRFAWTGQDAQGRATACLLAAIAPETGFQERASACPSKVMPSWLAHLTPWMDDAGSVEAWLPMVTRYANLANRWHVLDTEAWHKLHYKVRAICVQEAMRHINDGDTMNVCSAVVALCERVASGEEVTAEEWQKVRSAASAYYTSAAPDAAYAAYAAADAASAYAAADAASAAAAADAASAASAYYTSAAYAARRLAADSITSLILYAIEVSVCAAESK